jgi:aspartate/methionine/tyrosine aminotransferase
MNRKESNYMHWAKTRSQARFNLASSGVAPFPLGELKADFSAMEINSENSYGYAPLQQAIADHCGVHAECVVEAAGTSMANHLAMAAMLEPEDEVLLEQPTYGLLVDLAKYLRVSLKRFQRRQENGWAIDPDELRRAISARTKLIVLTNPHNPTSVFTGEETLAAIYRIAESVGASVLVDEVYLETAYAATPRSAFQLGPRFVTTNSLTKAYGLSGLRCGWILAQPDLAWKIRRLNDLFGSVPVHPGEFLSVAAFKNLPALRQRAKRLVDRDRAALASFSANGERLSAVETPSGTTVFPRLRSGDVDSFVERLRNDFETTVVPGRFFEMPDHFRIGMGVDNEMFAEGLSRIGKALR